MMLLRRLLSKSPRIAFTGSILFLSALYAVSGSLSVTDFSSPSESYRVVTGSAVYLEPRDTATLQIYRDQRPAGTNSKSHSGFVTANEPDSFRFFWAKESAVTEGYYSVENRIISIVPGAVTKEGEVHTNTDSLSTNVHSVHGAEGTDFSMVSVLDRYQSSDITTPVGVLKVAADRNAYFSDNEPKLPFNSMWHLSNDTFAVVSGDNYSVIVLRYMVSQGDFVDQVYFDTIATEGDDGGITNPSIDSDASGRMMVTFARGDPNSSKRLDYLLINRDGSIADSGNYAQDVSLSDGAVEFEDGMVASYGDGRFVSAYWKEDGSVYADTLVYTGGSVNTGSFKLASGTENRITAVASNGDKVVAAWKNLSEQRIDGVICDVSSGIVDFDNSRRIVLTSDTTELDINSGSKELFLAVDARGNIAAVWTQRYRAGGDWGDEAYVMGSIWGDLSVVYPEGYWVSGVEQIDKAAGDSVVILRGSADTSLYQGRLDIEVKTGDDDTPSDWSSDWMDVGDSLMLDSLTKGTDDYFRYRFVFYDDPDDSVRTPVLNDFRLDWNVKPEVDAIDSVYIKGPGGVTGLISEGNDFGDTIRVYSRSDTSGLRIICHDADTEDVLRLYTEWEGRQYEENAAGSLSREYAFEIEPASATGLHNLRFTADDSKWESAQRGVYIDAVNHAPVVNEFTAVLDTSNNGLIDTLSISGGEVLYLPESEMLHLEWSVADTNDPDIKAYLLLNGVAVDSSRMFDSSFLDIDYTEFSGAEDTLALTITDPDTTVELGFFIRAEDAPEITSVTYGGNEFQDGDSVEVVMEADSVFSVNVDDLNVSSWDSLVYRFSTSRPSGFDTAISDGALSIAPTTEDTGLVIRVTDTRGRSDSAVVWFVYPWFETDSTENPDYQQGMDLLDTGISFIVGSDTADTVSLPVLNTGNSDLRIDSIGFSNTSYSWLSAGVELSSGIEFYNQAQAGGVFNDLAIAPGESMSLFFVFSEGELSGDGRVHDTLTLYTDDPVHREVSIPVSLEHNDLPVLDSLYITFSAEIPLPLSKSLASDQNYKFPPHAEVNAVFSEAMDTAGLETGVYAYSYYDSIHDGILDTIKFSGEWDSSLTRVKMFPEYKYGRSDYFGINTIDGFFIPTDSVGFVFSSLLTDTAVTVSGPNSLDVNMDYTRDTDEDTVIFLSIDSVDFTLDSVYPTDNQVLDSTDIPVTLVFNSPVYQGTIDTSDVDNSSLEVISMYYTSADSMRRIGFDSVVVEGSRAHFFPSKEFFYGDSIKCIFHAVSARDTMGYPSDNNGDGIPDALFDSASSDDDVIWEFTVNSMNVSSVTPGDNTDGVSLTAPAVLEFPAELVSGGIDTSLNHNHSL
ncbi:MAG: hypothetical protein ACOCSE_00680, partial [Chitinivibrionales bacterium]